MRESRSAVIAHHVRAALRHAGLTERAYAQAVAELYEQRTPDAHRTVQFSDAADYYERERANAQQLSRLLLNPTADGRNGRLPADLEDACVLCLPGIYRAACLRELAARYGLMAAPEAPRGSGEECLRAADLLRETAEAVRALPTVLEGDDAPDASALERAEAELADVAAVVASLRASVQRRRHNVVQLRSAR